MKGFQDVLKKKKKKNQKTNEREVLLKEEIQNKSKCSVMGCCCEEGQQGQGKRNLPKFAEISKC
jgi:hypothetical protein